MKNIIIKSAILVVVLFLFITCSKSEEDEVIPIIEYNLKITITPNDGGTVTPSNSSFDKGSSVKITGEPSTGYIFKEWKEDVTGTTNPLTVTMNSNKTITAVFEELDTDGDGVSDNEDTCTNTPSGEDVDSNGCSTSQIDTDGDGVMDGVDSCSNTLNGQTVDTNGCSSSQKDSDGDGITDNLDSCSNTPTGQTVDTNGCPSSQKTYVPDDNFEQALIDLGYDDVLDDYVLTSIINIVDSLEIIDKGITDLTGIEDFISLVYLKTSDGVLDFQVNENGNQISSIDVSNNIKLEYLDLGENKLKTLDISKNPNLVYLEIHFNEITTLDLSFNPKLEVLSAGYNQLETIDISKNPNLINFQFFNNQLTNLDISNNSKLEIVFIHNIPQSFSFHSHPFVNKLTSLDLTNNPNIRQLWFRNNDFSSINVSQNKNLSVLVADNNQLTSLDVSAITDLTYLNAQNNPNLTCIQIDQTQIIKFADWDKDASASYSLNCN